MSTGISVQVRLLKKEEYSRHVAVISFFLVPIRNVRNSKNPKKDAGQTGDAMMMLTGIFKAPLAHS